MPTPQLSRAPPGDGAALRLSLFYAAFFLASGVQLPFWPVWLQSRGLGATEIGTLLAISQWIKVPTNPLLGMLADRAADRSRAMLLLAALSLAGYVLCVPVYGFAAMIVPTLIIAASSSALMPLADASALAAASAGRLDYGQVRLWGTIAFIVASLATGRILSGRGADIVLYLMLATMALTTASCITLPRLARPPRGGAPLSSWRGMMTPRHVAFLAAAMLIQASHAVYYGFGTLYWQRLGHADTTIAWLWAEGVIFEVGLFFIGARLLRRWGPLALMAIGGGGGCLRWAATAYATSLPALVLLQPLHALSFAAAHLGAMHYLARTLPPGQAGMAQSVYAAVVNGIGFGIASLFSGALYEAYGGGAYLAMAVMAGAGAALAAALARRS